jgi:DNA-directed RNA polymerase I subunit RPA1
MNPSHSIAGHISGVDFGFLSSDDIKALAVTKITNPYTFDGLVHPNVGGLYDPALGSFRNETYV